jgi:hypothetical protein
MNDSIEFTPKEKFVISLYQDPSGLLRRAIVRALTYLIPSVGLVAYSWYCGNIAYGIIGYGILLFRAIFQMTRLKRAFLTTASIYRKFEAQLQRQQRAA